MPASKRGHQLYKAQEAQDSAPASSLQSSSPCRICPAMRYAATALFAALAFFWAAPSAIAGPLYQFDTPVVDSHLSLVSSPASGQDVVLSTKSRYNIPDQASQLDGPARPPSPVLTSRRRCRPTESPTSPKCAVAQIQLVARHGTRNPTAGNLKKHQALQKKFANYTAPSADFAFLSNFSLFCNTSSAGQLTAQGHFDLVQLAQRLKARFPEPLSNTSLITWQATNVSRAIASAESFQTGLLSSASDIARAQLEVRKSVLPVHLDADLRAHDSCKNYSTAFKIAEALPDRPQDVFTAARYPAILSRLQSALALPTLTLEDLSQLFSLCSFEDTIRGKVAKGFCSLFTRDEVNLADFAGDLEFWSERGYGFSPNEAIGCSLLTTLVSNMEAHVNGSATIPAVMKFGHAETLGPLIATLGLFRTTLSPNATDAQIASRSYRAAQFTPFAGNLLVELSSCADSTHHVRVLVDEVPVAIPGCGEQCELGAFKKLYADKIGCDFDGQICGNPRPTVGGAATFRRKDSLTDADATPSDDA
ncbi:PHOsphatase [Geranomyces variabilis]|nr:PHOsphatase [Geranomyces variabilis]